MDLGLIDRITEGLARRLARRTSRRGFLGAVGASVAGVAAWPLLPVARPAQARTAPLEGFAATAQTHDDQQCNYWRYCAIDGTLCTCCGGSVSSCPPGTKSPPTAWVGSCVNPDDGETYLVVYRDCCGKGMCMRCPCTATEGEMPIYRPQLNGDIIWCFGAGEMTYTCTHSALIGKA